MELAEICVLVGFCKSKTEARKSIAAGAIRINDIKVTDPYSVLVKIEDCYALFPREARKCQQISDKTSAVDPIIVISI
jgi:ribosomal protein S4